MLRTYIKTAHTPYQPKNILYSFLNLHITAHKSYEPKKNLLFEHSNLFQILPMKISTERYIKTNSDEPRKTLFKCYTRTDSVHTFNPLWTNSNIYLNLGRILHMYWLCISIWTCGNRKTTVEGLINRSIKIKNKRGHVSP